MTGCPKGLALIRCGANINHEETNSLIHCMTVNGSSILLATV